MFGEISRDPKMFSFNLKNKLETAAASNSFKVSTTIRGGVNNFASRMDLTKLVWYAVLHRGNNTSMTLERFGQGKSEQSSRKYIQ